LEVQVADARTHVEPARTPILVIDDDRATLELVRSVLEANGYACLAASSGEEGLELIRSTPDLLVAISDISMPGIDGISLLERITTLAGREAPRVIFLTAYPSIDHAVAALRLGAIDFLTKPVRPQNLLSVVRNAVARVQRERAVSSLPQQAATLAQQAEIVAATLKGWAQMQPQEGAQSLDPGQPPTSQSDAVHPRDFALLGLDHLHQLRRAVIWMTSRGRC
jgi:CheY-like chemotaxis protein